MINNRDRFIQAKCDRCGRTTRALQNGIGDLYTLPETFGPPLMDEGSFCAACCARYDKADWEAWMAAHRPEILLGAALARPGGEPQKEEGL